jgi:hypothetical protein
MTDDTLPPTRAPHRLADALREQPDPPCSRCEYVLLCNLPDRCKAFSFYVKTGKQTEPPKQPPWS